MIFVVVCPPGLRGRHQANPSGVSASLLRERVEALQLAWRLRHPHLFLACLHPPRLMGRSFLRRTPWFCSACSLGWSISCYSVDWWFPCVLASWWWPWRFALCKSSDVYQPMVTVSLLSKLKISSQLVISKSSWWSARCTAATNSSAMIVNGTNDYLIPVL